MKKAIFNLFNGVHYLLTLITILGGSWVAIDSTNPELLQPIKDQMTSHPVAVGYFTVILGSLMSFWWVIKIVRNKMMDSKYHIDNFVIGQISSFKEEAQNFYGQYENRDNLLIGIINDLIKRDEAREGQLKQLIDFNVLQMKRNLESNLVSPQIKAEIANYLEAIKNGSAFDIAIGELHKYVEVVHKYVEEKTEEVVQEVDPRIANILGVDDNG